MKMVYYKVKKQSKKREKKPDSSFERLLYISFVITFVVLVIVQAALTNPSVRTYLTLNADFEGTPLQTEEYLYNKGELGLALLRGDVDGSVKVLVNGQEAAAFNGKELTIEVKEGDVIEIDCSMSMNTAEVEVVSYSGNISPECVGKRVEVKSGIKKLVKVQVGI